MLRLLPWDGGCAHGRHDILAVVLLAGVTPPPPRTSDNRDLVVFLLNLPVVLLAGLMLPPTASRRSDNRDLVVFLLVRRRPFIELVW